MKKLIIAALFALLATACAKQEEAAPAADQAAATEAAPAADAAQSADAAAADASAAADAAADASAAADAAAAPVDSGLPQACEDYLTRAKACFAKAGGNASAAAFQQGVDQAKAQWEAMADKTGLDAACQQANAQFAQTAAMLKCE